jgi:hypothetical protein
LVSSFDFNPASIRLHHFARISFIVKQFHLFLLKSSIIFPIRLFQSPVESLLDGKKLGKDGEKYWGFYFHGISRLGDISLSAWRKRMRLASQGASAKVDFSPGLRPSSR